MTGRIFFSGVTSGIIAAVMSLVYAAIYKASLGADFSEVVTTTGIFSACIFSGMMMATGYRLLHKWLKQRTEAVFNIILVMLSFISIIAPFSATLPLHLETPELFPGLTVPMHFFPALAWFALKPFFIPGSPLPA